MNFWRPGDKIPSISVDRENEKEEIKFNTTSFIYNKYNNLSLNQQRILLPVYSHRREILYAIETHTTTIIVGETGSGKTTQIPQYLYESAWNYNGKMIVCTQPRRLAAITIAERVANEVGCELGNEIGYATRFDERWDIKKTKIKFCTDGLLLKETLNDPLLSNYSVIMLDEAHERSLHTDVLLGLLRKVLIQRSDLRIVISSATLYAKSFLDFFGSKNNVTNHEAPNAVTFIAVQGRQYDVDIQYLKKPTSNYLEKAAETVVSIHENEEKGDILVFLPGQEQIDYVSRCLMDLNLSKLLILPLYASLPKNLQKKVFMKANPGYRKVILATTIAETSLTIDGIVYVIDSCFVKLPFYDPITGMESLLTIPVSQAGANQRAGRAGRTCHGKCFRLITENDFNTKLEKNTIPAIQRTNLTSIILNLLSLGINNISNFNFIDKPSNDSIDKSTQLLYAIGAIDDNHKLTDPVGHMISIFPIEPQIAKMLITSIEMKCTEEALTVAALLSVQDIYMVPKGSQDKKAQMCESLKEFADPTGDHWTCLNIYNEYIERNGDPQWCYESFLNRIPLMRAREIRKQLYSYLYRLMNGKIKKFESCGDNKEILLKCIVSGFFANAAKLDMDGLYKTVKDSKLVKIHPISVFNHFGTIPKWIIYSEYVLTNDEYIRDISRIDPRWLLELSNGFYFTKDKSALLSGDSGKIGLPENKILNNNKNKLKISKDVIQDIEITNQIKYQKPTVSKQKLPIHIGKSKGGLRSQF